jgi:hypothetical protein
MLPKRAPPNDLVEPARGLGGSSSVKMLEGNSEVAVGLRGAPAVRALISASVIPDICSERGTIAMSLFRSK